jgi:hypothetical protein
MKIMHSGLLVSTFVFDSKDKLILYPWCMVCRNKLTGFKNILCHLPVNAKRSFMF